MIARRIDLPAPYVAAVSLFAALVFACACELAHGAITLDGNNGGTGHTLLPNTAGQEVPIFINTDASDMVTGMNLQVALGDGMSAGAEPVFQGTPGTLQAVDFGATGSIWNAFASTASGEAPVSGFPQYATPSVLFNSAGNQVTASGLAATLLVDTTGFSSGTFGLTLDGTVAPIGASDLLGTGGALINPSILNGTITILADPDVITNLLVGFGGQFGPELTTVGDQQDVQVVNNTVIAAEGILTVLLDGTFRSGQTTNEGIVRMAGGTFVASAAETFTNTSGGVLEGYGLVQAAATNNGGVIRANGGNALVLSSLAAQTGGGELRADDGSTLSIQNSFVNDGSTIVLGGDNAILSGTEILNDGNVRGRGRVAAPLANRNSGVVRAEEGQLTLAGDTNSNQSGALIEAGAAATVFYTHGLPASSGTIALTGGAFDNNNHPINNNSGGMIAGHGDFRSGGLTNDGVFNVGGGVMNVIGSVDHNVTYNVEEDSTVIYFDDVSGLGNDGPGAVHMLAGFMPGNSPAEVGFGGDFLLASTSSLTIELAGTAIGQFDRLDVAGTAVVGGSLEVNLLDQFQPSAGDDFEIIAAARGINGTFTTDASELPALGSGLEWAITYGSSNVLLQVIGPALPGDYDGNGVVDAADYVAWRNHLGAPAGALPNDADGGIIGLAQYATWKANFGATAGSSVTAGNAAVPEPTTALLVILAAVAAIHQRRVFAL